MPCQQGCAAGWGLLLQTVVFTTVCGGGHPSTMHDPEAPCGLKHRFLLGLGVAGHLSAVKHCAAAFVVPCMSGMAGPLQCWVSGLLYTSSTVADNVGRHIRPTDEL